VTRSAPAQKLCGIWGKPFIDLEYLIGADTLRAVDDEITLGLVDAELGQTGASLKWMGVTAPWVNVDPYVDAMRAIESFSFDEWSAFVALADDSSVFDASKWREYTFGDETDHPFNARQRRFLELRHNVYFPWQVCVHLLANDRWEDKHSGDGKDFSDEARALFPDTIKVIEALPFVEIGRALIFGLKPNDHAPAHRDTEPGSALSIPHSISIDPRGDKRFYLTSSESEESAVVVDKHVYWFNDMDWHGVLADPFFRYSLRIDGVFEPSFLRDLEKRV